MPGEEKLEDALRAVAAKLAPTHPDAEKILILTADGYTRKEIKGKLGHRSYSRIDVTRKAARTLLLDFAPASSKTRGRKVDKSSLPVVKDSPPSPASCIEYDAAGKPIATMATDPANPKNMHKRTRTAI